MIVVQVTLKSSAAGRDDDVEVANGGAEIDAVIVLGETAALDGAEEMSRGQVLRLRRAEGHKQEKNGRSNKS